MGEDYICNRTSGNLIARCIHKGIIPIDAPDLNPANLLPVIIVCFNLCTTFKFVNEFLQRLTAIPMNNVIDTLLIFNKLSNDMVNCTIALLKGEAYDPDKTNQLGPDQAVVNCLMDMIIIESVSFIDEYNKHFGVTTEIEYKERILNVKKLCKPVLKQINKWQDLKIIRNSFLAHNLRLSDRTMIFRKELNQNAPRSFYEVEFLNNLIQLIFQVISSSFKKELMHAKSTFDLKIAHHNPSPRENNWKIIDSLKDQIEVEIEKLQLDFSI